MLGIQSLLMWWYKVIVSDLKVFGTTKSIDVVTQSS
jgi:hypothetical protein